MSSRDVARRLAVVTGALCFIGVGSPSPAGPLGILQVAMSVAASAHEHLPAFADVHSVRMTMTERGGPTMVAIADWDRHAFKMSSPQRGDSLVYFVDGTTYSQSRDGTWSKFDAHSLARAVSASSTGNASPSPVPRSTRVDDRVQRLPDRIVHGVRIGSFRVREPARYFDRHLSAPAMVTVTCFYEKANSRLQSCSSPGTFTMRFDRYDDPANRFTVPSAALHAPDAFP